MILAQAASNGVELAGPGWLWQGLAVFSVLGNAGMGLAFLMGKKTQIGPQPFIVAMKEKFVELLHHKEDIKKLEDSDDKLEADIGHLGEKIEGVQKTLQEDGSRRAAQINGRVDGVSDQVARVDERSQNTNLQLTLLGQKVDRVIERLKA